MIEKHTTKLKHDKRLRFTGDVVRIGLFGDRCNEVLTSNHNTTLDKHAIVSAQLETIQRMLLPDEYTEHFAEIHKKVDDAIAHNRLQEADDLRMYVKDLLQNDPLAIKAHDQAVLMLSNSIDPRNLAAFYDTIQEPETIPPASQRAAIIGHKVLGIILKYGNSLIPTKQPS